MQERQNALHVHGFERERRIEFILRPLLGLMNADEKTNLINLLRFSPLSIFGRSRLPQRMTQSSTQTRMPAATNVRFSVFIYGSSSEAWDMNTSHGSV